MSGENLGAMMARLRQTAATGDAKATEALLAEILAIDPGFMPAHRWKIDQLLDAKAYQAAIDLCCATQMSFPNMSAMTAMKQAVALDRLGDKAAAITLLSQLHDDNLQDVPASALYAGLLMQTGARDTARPLFEAICKAEPNHAAGVRGLIDIALADDRAHDALALCKEVLEKSPALRSVAMDRLARSYAALGDIEAAHATLDEVLRDAPNSVPGHMLRAQLHQKSWDLNAADAAFTRVLDHAPNHVAAWQGRAAVLMQKGDLDGALEINAKAIETLNPPPESLYRQRASILSSAHRSGEVIETLQALLKSGTARPAIRRDLAQAYLESGDLGRASTWFALCMNHPDTREAGLMGQVRIAQVTGDDLAALSLLRSSIGGGARPLDPGASPALVRVLCDTAIRAGQTDNIETLLMFLVERADALTDQDLNHVFALAERQALPAVAGRLLDKVAKRTALSLDVAKILLKQAHVMADSDLLAHLVKSLSSRLPVAHQAVFRIEAQAMMKGPVAALVLARNSLPAPRIPRDASLIGRFLIDAGRISMALRYLRLATRTWPGNRAVCSLYIHVCTLAGQQAEAHRFLEAQSARFPYLDNGLDRLRLMHSQQVTVEALALDTARRSSGLPSLHPRQHLDLCLATGDLDKAEAAMRNIRADPSSTSRAAAHFTTGLHGRMLTDLRVYRAVEAAQIKSGRTSQDIRNQLAEQYYYPAKCVLEDWISDRGGLAQTDRSRPQVASLPKKIFQYWDAKTPPAEVADLIHDWRGVGGFTHTLFDRSLALNILRTEFGPRCVKAFQRARHVTEESDFLRLCLIYKFGGLYVDADDKLVGDINAFAKLGAGLVVAREPIGALANNILAAPPKNPVLRIATQMAMRSLLANENDGAWFKTGPGMLTRAVGRFITQSDPQSIAANLTILDANTLRRFVQPHIKLPYKTTVKYWNTQERKLGKTVLESLGALR